MEKSEEDVAKQKQRWDQAITKQEQLIKQSYVYIQKRNEELKTHNLLNQIEKKYEYYEDEIVQRQKVEFPL